ncbi:hypothetical protein M728_001877 [Ensifer sp. WSM1721]|uniref:hypothetical protein n=1 Tax=Ensifer sp. WSM1721 TaxID=1041159 RepID=UPI001FD95387|nr:hypothetical protein [Ensifer sp. WSM1721]
MSDWKGSSVSGTSVGKVERRRLTASNAAYISPEDASAYAESLLQAALYGPNAYLPEGLRKPLGGLSKDPRDEDAYAPGARAGLSELQKNLEDVKTELKFLLPKVSNEDGASALSSIISSIQATQDGVDDRERSRVYENPYRHQPNLYDEHKQTFEKYGEPSERLIKGADGPWEQGRINNRLRPSMTLKQALSRWRE